MSVIAAGGAGSPSSAVPAVVPAVVPEVVPEVVPAVKNARIDARALELCAVMTIYGDATFAFLNEFLGPDAEADAISQTSDTTKKTGAFSDKGITYYLAKEKEVKEYDPTFIHIDFITKDSHESIGTISLNLTGERAELITIDATHERYKGAGTRMMTAVEDITRLAGYDTLVLKSKRTALGFYLGLESPYNFARPKNGILYNKAFATAVKEGQPTRNAKKAAAKTFVVPGEVNLIPLVKTFKPRHRTRRNSQRRSRKK
jgi:hypothetical protein